MFSKKRLTFQLTPLLDLLLIVIFAQYMEVQQTSAQAEQEIARRAAAQTEAALKAQLEAEGLAKNAAERLRALEAQRETVRAELEKRLADMNEELERELALREQVQKLIAQFFHIPKEDLDKVLSQDLERKAAEREELRELVKKLADARRNEAVKHLLAHQAMRKRVDVWELFIGEEGIVQLRTGDETRSFRFRTRSFEQEEREIAKLPEDQRLEAIQKFDAQAAETFKREFLEAVRSLPQPKSIVVLLVSWKTAGTYYREPALKGLKFALEQLQISNNATTFVRAILGLELKP